MSRYIDADALMETIKTHDYPLRDYFNSTDNGMFTIGIQQAVDEQPTVDAVPVVRCEDCKHHEVCKNGVNGWCNEHERPTDVTYFCADGERKEQDDATN